MKQLFLQTIFIYTLTITLAFGQTVIIEGRTRVIDGDTIKIEKSRIRLHGIDAPENKQLCKDKKLSYWLCGQVATKALRKKINNRVVECLSDKKDRYKRHIAICFVDGVNLNRWLVLNGWAVAYRKHSKDYIEAETAAKSIETGIWTGEFILPWEWRRGKRLKQ